MKLWSISLLAMVTAGAYAQSGPSYDFSPPQIGLVSATGSYPYVPMTTTGTAGQQFDFAPTVLLLGYNSTTKKYYVCGTANPCSGSGGGGGGTGSGTVSPNSTTTANPLAVYNTNGGSTTVQPATPAQIQAAATDPTKNAAYVYQAGTGGDTTCPTPTSGQDIFCYMAAYNQVYRSINGAAYAAIAAGAGTVTHTVGALTLNTMMLGNGGADSKVGLATDDGTTFTYAGTGGIKTTGTNPQIKSNTASNNDLNGVLTLASGNTTTSTYTFGSTYTSAPICTMQTQNASSTTLATMGQLAPQVSTTAISATVSTAPGTAVNVGYICIGRN